jgi:septum formation protein
MKTILASKSPRRKEILSTLGVKYECEPTDIDESVPEGATPIEAVESICYRKAFHIAQKYKDKDVLVISADTVVCLDGKIYGKPQSKEHAIKMLEAFSGTTHEILSGFTLIYAGKSVTKSVSTKVKFKPLDKEEILYYVENGSPMDKAGAYGIQEKGSLFVEKIDGDYFNVVGLPVFEIFKTLKEEFSLQFKDLI